MTYYVYVDWTTEETPRPFYVGKGQKLRLRNMKPRNKLHENLSKKYGIDRRVEFSTEIEDESYAKERELIAQYKTYVHGGDSYWGANFTLGGDGVRGRHPKLSQKHRDAIGAANSHPKSEETKAKMKLAAQRRASDPEWIKKMQEVAKKRWQDPAYVAKRVGMKYNKEPK